MSQAASDGNTLEISLSAQLIEDYLYVKDAPAPALGEGDIGAFSNGLVAVDGSGLMLVERDSASQSGWRTTTIEVPMPQTATSAEIRSLRVFEVQGNANDSSGANVGATTLNVLCLFPAPDGCFAVSWMVRATVNPPRSPPTVGPWQPANLDTSAKSFLSQVKQVDVVDVANNVGWMVYGTTNDIIQPLTGFVFALYIGNYLDIVGSIWALKSQMKRSMLPLTSTNAQIALVTAKTPSGSSWSAYSVALCCWDEQTFWWAQLSDSGNLGSSGPYSSFEPAISVTQLVGTPAADQGPPVSSWPLWEIFAIDSGLNLWRCRFGYSIDVVDGRGLYVGSLEPFQLSVAGPPSNPPKAPQNVDHFVLATHGDDRSAFAVDAFDRLWMLRDVTSSTPNWVPLGNLVNAISPPLRTAQVVELYYADAQASGKASEQNQIFHLSQDSGSSVWIEEKIATMQEIQGSDPKTGPTKVSTIAIDVAVSLGHRPVPEAFISVTSDQLTNLILEDGSQWVAPGGTPASFQADEMGRASVRFWAKSLKFPQLEFTASDPNAGSVSLSCHGDVVDGVEPPISSVANRLAGNDNHPDDPKQFSLSQDNLQAAHVLGPGTSPKDAAHVIDLVNTIGVWMKKKTAPAKAPSAPMAMPARTWQLSIADDGSFSCNEISAPGFSLGSWWGDATGDVLHLVKHTAEAVSSWTVQVAGDVLTFAVAGYNCTVDSLREAGDLVGSIFRSIRKDIEDVEKFIKEVVAFFEMLFEWDDILRTHKVMRHVFNFFLDYGKSDQLTEAIDTYIGDVKSGVDTALGKAKTFFGANTQSASGYADQVSGQPDFLKAKPNKLSLLQHSSRCHYVLSRTKSSLKKSNLTASKSGGFNSNSIQKHWNTQDNKQSVADLQSHLSNNDPAAGDLLDQPPAAAIIDLAEKLINAAFNGLEDVVDDLLGMLETLIGDFDGVVNTGIDIPVVSYLWTYVITSKDPPFKAGDKLTILDALCLILAVPTTILYKLIRDEAPFDEAAVANVYALFNRKLLKLDFAGVSSPQSPSPQSPSPQSPLPQLAGDDVISGLSLSFGVCSGVLGLFGSSIGMYLDYKTIKDAPDGQSSDFVSTLLGYVSLVLSIESTAFNLPLSTFAEFDKSKAAGEVLQILYYGSQWLPIASDFAALRFDETITEQCPGFGPIAAGLFGCVIAGLGLAYVFEGSPSKWDIANMALSVFPRPWRMLIAGADDAEAMPVIMAIIMVTDFIGLAGGAATEIGAAIADNT